MFIDGSVVDAGMRGGILVRNAVPAKALYAAAAKDATLKNSELPKGSANHSIRFDAPTAGKSKTFPAC
jgi:hypothetical protein